MPRYLAVCFTALALLAGCGHPPEQVAYTGAVPAAPTTTVATTTTTLPPPPPTTTTTDAVEPIIVSRAATPPAPAQLGTVECGGWRDLIAAHFPAEQVDRACRVMMCESGGNPTAANRSSSASGLYQFLDGTWDGLDGRRGDGYAGVARAMYAPPDVQIAAAALLWASSGWSPWVCR